jgi:hypothetical protein
MGQRDANAIYTDARAPKQYKYPTPAGVAAGYRGHEECEVENDAHVVRPTSWPPRPKGVTDFAPTMDLLCELCGCHVLAEAAHATGQLKGVKVILPEPAPVSAAR